MLAAGSKGVDMPSTDLVEIISGKLTGARLPREWPEDNSGGWGLGQTCAACDAAFHTRCFVQWWDLVGANGWARRRT
jgi:hypothetical protein